MRSDVNSYRLGNRGRFQKLAHNPLLLAAGFAKTNLPIHWLDGKRLRLVFR
jgi:hypothetical protein